MAEMIVVRHGQASFGTDNYDRLSDLGHQQSNLAGDALRAAGWIPDRIITGTLVRQKETLSSMGFIAAPEEHAGLNEYDFNDLLRVRHGGTIPDMVHLDRKTHFRTLRETIFEWQAGGLENTKESWHDFTTRVAAARSFATDIKTHPKVKRVLVISSGGPIGQMVASALEAPAAQMVAINLQIKNTSMTRFVFSSRSIFLNEFNATPHFMTDKTVGMLTYS